MTYDDWKTESPEDEWERLNAPARREAERASWMEDHEDMLREDREERLAAFHSGGWRDEE